METFGVLLRRHRMAAVLTQERLAELARISATGIAALEAGRRRTPRPSTVALLLDALDPVLGRLRHDGHRSRRTCAGARTVRRSGSCRLRPDSPRPGVAASHRILLPRLCRADDTEFAPVLYDLLAANPARAIGVGPLAGWWAPADYHLGALCRVMGRFDEAELRLRSALTTTEHLGARPWQARTQIELARVIEIAHGSADTTITALRESAASIAADLGAAGIAALLR